MKRIKRFFIRKQHHATVGCWYHGFFYNKYESNEFVTVLLPLAPLARLLRALYFHFKFGSHDSLRRSCYVGSKSGNGLRWLQERGQ